MAIAWLHRVDYARAGMAMLPALPGSEGIAGRRRSSTPRPRTIHCSRNFRLAGPAYAAGALLLGLGYLAASIAFALRETRVRARILLYTSLVYLPALFAVVFLDPAVRATIRL